MLDTFMYCMMAIVAMFIILHDYSTLISLVYIYYTVP